jgi:hypothetical protein
MVRGDCPLFVLGALAVVAGAGCGGAEEGPAGDPAVGTARQAFNTYSYTHIAYPADGVFSGSVNLGADPQTCFLAAVGGSMYTEFSSAAVDTYWTGSTWELNVGNPSNRALYGASVCLPTATNRTNPVYWNQGMGKQHLGAVTAYRTCGLIQIDTPYIEIQMPPTEYWQSPDDSLHIVNDGKDWWLTGSGKAEGFAQCVDVDTPWGIWEWIAPSSGSHTISLLSGPNLGVGFATGNQCFLTGVSGPFNHPDYQDGVYVDYVKSAQQWRMTVKNGKTGFATCVE